MLRSDIDLLKHINEETLFILQHVTNKNFEAVLNDAILNRAIIRSLEIIGEASKKLSKEFTSQYSIIEWKKIAATRNKLIHEYFGVDYEIVWDIVQNKLPELKKVVSSILKTEK